MSKIGEDEQIDDATIEWIDTPGIGDAIEAMQQVFRRDL
jgi:hypothetical protein